MRRFFLVISASALMAWSATCGGIAVVDGSNEGSAGESGSDGNTSGFVAQNTTVGPSTSSLGGTTSGPDDPCHQMPDFQSCAQCYCQTDMAGCDAYIALITGHFYCGVTCSMTCAEYCANPRNTAPTPACEMCVGTIDCNFPPPGSPQETDCNAAIAFCQADPDCIGFATNLQNCPQS